MHGVRHLFAAVLFAGSIACQSADQDVAATPPNILILMSDNHSWNHLGCYGDTVVKTPYIDGVAARGVRFTNAYCSAPSCTPARAAMLSGQDIWRLEEGANLWGIFPAKYPVYTDRLEEAGYLVGFQGKGWGPGDYAAGGRARNPAGEKFNSFEEFYNARKSGQPFYYWFSSRNPHRPYPEGGAEDAGIDLSAIEVPPYLPDNEDVRTDIAEYYAEVQGFDDEVSGFLSLLSEYGELENTIVVVASDNGWQMPRGLANLYDFGSRIPLIIALPDDDKARAVDDFVNLADLAPTILDWAGLPPMPDMTAKSLVPLLASGAGGVVDAARDAVFMGRERHAYVRQGGLGYPARALRTKEFLYVRNYEPERWPAGDPPLFGDVDAHMLHYRSPAKLSLLVGRAEAGMARYFEMGFAKRPAEELFDLAKDPHQMTNVADDPDYAEAKARMSERLTKYLVETGDPRETGEGFDWDGAEYFATKDFRPRPMDEAVEKLGLEESYSYIK